jgi:hypothetical protein
MADLLPWHGGVVRRDQFYDWEQGGQMSLWKNVQNVAQNIFLLKLIHDFFREKVAKTWRAASLIFKK